MGNPTSNRSNLRQDLQILCKKIQAWYGTRMTSSELLCLDGQVRELCKFLRSGSRVLPGTTRGSLTLARGESVDMSSVILLVESVVRCLRGLGGRLIGSVSAGFSVKQ